MAGFGPLHFDSKQEVLDNSIDEHLVTYWVLSKTPFSDSNTNHLEDVCDCRNVPGACGGNIPICDLGTAQGYCRDCQSNAECTAKDATKPVCNSIATGGTDLPSLDRAVSGNLPVSTSETGGSTRSDAASSSATRASRSRAS